MGRRSDRIIKLRKHNSVTCSKECSIKNTRKNNSERRKINNGIIEKK